MSEWTRLQSTGSKSTRSRSWPLRGRQGRLILAFAAAGLATALPAKMIDPPVRLGQGGRLQYVVDARGDRIVDFSHAGYRGGGVPLPVAAPRVRVAPTGGDDGARIQAAIDFVAGLPVGANGLRGAVVLAPGRFLVPGRLQIVANGVVLRGAGAGPDGTVLVATGIDRRPLIEIGPRKVTRTESAPVAVADAYTPVGAMTVRVANADGFAPGTRIAIERPSTLDWIKALGMEDAPGRQPYEWKAGTLNVRWERVVTAVNGNALSLDAPLSVALDAPFGGGTVRRMEVAGRVEHAGVEGLSCESPADAANPRDEEHSWTAVHIGAARDVWVADLAGKHFPGSLVFVGAEASRVTVQDCLSQSPISEDGGFRRMTFHTAGQQTLFLRCRAEQGRNDFTTGHLAAGPNVFLECVAHEPRSFSGSAGSWASGILFDNVTVDGGALRLDNLETWNQGVGWAAANSMIWQSSASTIVVRSPPGTLNWAVGPWAQFVGDGRWAAVNEYVRPDSLYVTQLIERVGRPATAALERRRPAAAAGEAPWLEAAVADLGARLAPKAAAPGKPLALAGGWLLAEGRLLTGGQAGMTYWRGSTLAARAPEVGFSISRFAPDRFGTGLTDELGDVADALQARNQVALRHHWGLWYDRRRDDHEMIRRAEGDVWAPFYEYPWARTGHGVASNGLSQYDLTKFNPWYFRRVRDFAGLARERGLVLIDEMYFQHNILEAGAHWAEFPWRAMNNVNAVGFPEPPVYLESDGSAPSRPEYGKRIFVAELFYDVSHPVRRALHRQYIRQCLDNLADQPNVIHLVGAEHTGPLAFTQFWLDTIAEWVRETGRQPLIGLSVTKDVQDAILADPVRSRSIDVIDFNYWWRTERDVHAPKGGANLSPRQHERLWRGGKGTATSVAWMVDEYRRKFPDKAIIAGLAEADGWAFVAAGGSLPKLPATTEARLLAALARMRPAGSGESVGARQWVLAEPGVQFFVFAAKGGGVAVELGGAAGTWRAHRIDLGTGGVLDGAPVTGSRFVPEAGGQAVGYWITR